MLTIRETKKERNDSESNSLFSSVILIRAVSYPSVWCYSL